MILAQDTNHKISKREASVRLIVMLQLKAKTSVYLRHKQGPGVNDVYKVSKATKERTLQKAVWQHYSNSLYVNRLETEIQEIHTKTERNRQSI